MTDACGALAPRCARFWFLTSQSPHRIPGKSSVPMPLQVRVQKARFRGSTMRRSGWRPEQTDPSTWEIHSGQQLVKMSQNVQEMTQFDLSQHRGNRLECKPTRSPLPSPAQRNSELCRKSATTPPLFLRDADPKSTPNLSKSDTTDALPDPTGASKCSIFYELLPAVNLPSCRSGLHPERLIAIRRM